MQKTLSEQQLIRRESLAKLKELGIDPFPAALFDVNTNTQKIKKDYKEGKTIEVSIAGRIMSRRIMGKASFAELKDSFGRIQLYVNRDEICPEENKMFYNTVFKKLLDIGDIIGITGSVFKTKVGETSINVKSIKLLSKSLQPLPLPKVDAEGNVYDAFTDAEKRYRQRYVDLIVNPDVKEVFIKRTKITNAMRSFLNKKGYLEVETPILQPIYGVLLHALLKHTTTL